jgi:hypothetical protein
MRRLLQAEERVEALKDVAAERGQKLVHLEVRCSELESANTMMEEEVRASARQALELKKAQDKVKLLSEAADLVVRLQHDLQEANGEKERLSDKTAVLEADLRQYEQELRLSQEVCHQYTNILFFALMH